jgi:hypothetical protein
MPLTAAFHFRVDEAEHGTLYGYALQDQFFLRLRDAPMKDIHLEVSTGDLLVPQHAGDEGAYESILRALLGYDPRRWRSVDGAEFASTLLSARIYVIAAEGLSRRLEEYLDHQLSRDNSYLGCIEVNPANRVHWALYKASLILRYRYLDGEVRLFYRDFEEKEGADTKNTGRAKDLERLGFRVAWEDLGLRHTVFDSYQTFEQAERLSELEGFLSEHLARVADEILLRVGGLDPRLNERLYAALSAFERIQTQEEIAHVALSCRRFLEGLADAVYPARAEPVEGRDVSHEAYRNRLWAYVKDNLEGGQQRLALTQLDDIGRRVDRIDQLANKGLHAQISQPDVRRLIAALLVLAYDLLLLSPPPLRASQEPYRENVEDFLRRSFDLTHGSAAKGEKEH